MPAILLKILPGIMAAIGKLLGPLAIYFKGRHDSKSATENKAMKGTSDDIQDANQAASDARDRARSGKLRDSDYRD